MIRRGVDAEPAAARCLGLLGLLLDLAGDSRPAVRCLGSELQPTAGAENWLNGKFGALPRYRSLLAGISCVLSGPLEHAHSFSGVVPAG
jgi:hypothetical protein